MIQFKPRIRTVLLIVNLAILLLPLLGIQALRLYENELIHQTEASLMAQGIVVREAYKAQLIEELVAADIPTDVYGIAIAPKFAQPEPGDRYFYEPLQPSLDISREKIRPKPADAVAVIDHLPDQLGWDAGQHLSPLLRSAQRNLPSGVRIVDFKGMVVASSSGELGRSLAHREEIKRALSGETISLLRDRGGAEPPPALAMLNQVNRVRIFMALPIVENNRVLGAVLLSRTPMDVRKALYLNRFVLLRYSAGLLVIVLLLSLLTAKTISRPIRALIEQTQRVRANVKEAAHPIPHPGSREIKQLSESIAAMACTLKERAEYIEGFARHVSHEFKTPLASIQGIVELLHDHIETMTAEERTRFLSMLDADAKRMDKLVTRLLVLAKADVAAPGASMTDIEQGIEGVIERYRHSGLHIDVTTSRGKARMAPEVFDSLLANLFDNARQHAGPTANISVETRLTRLKGGEGIAIAITDDGPGISKANLDKVFEPFFTTARDHGGTGLGLSIVKSLVDTHGGEVRLSNTDKGGLSVELVLPTASL